MVDNKPTERAPMLSDEEFTDVIGDAGSQSGLLVRDFYEAKITSGELRVVKKAKVDASIPGFIQCSCGVDVRTDEWQKWNFCPGCGAQIVNK